MSRLLPSVLPTLVLVLAAACSNSATDPSASLQTDNSTSTPATPGTGTGHHGNGENRGHNGENRGQNDENKAQRTRIEIVLVGSAAFGHAKGKAKFDVEGSQRELEIEVEELVALAGTSVDFFVGGAKVGSGIVSALGEAELELSTQRGNSVPASVTGLLVEARTGAGAVIASGSF